MIGKLERKDAMYKVLLKQIVTYAFVKARGNNGRISLCSLQLKFSQLKPSDVVSFMNEQVLRAIFCREITGDGIIYRLTANFRYAEFGDVSDFVNKQLKKK